MTTRREVTGKIPGDLALSPENRRKTGSPVPGGEVTQFKPGQSGNPGGRPKKKPLTEALQKIYSDPKEALAAAKALARKARKGSIAHFQEAANRLEGKVEGGDESHGTVSFHVTISAPRPLRDAIQVASPTEIS